MIEKLIIEVNGQAIELEGKTLIVNELGIPEYMVFEEEELRYGELNQEQES